jgi:hypothetical protein
MHNFMSAFDQVDAIVLRSRFQPPGNSARMGVIGIVENQNSAFPPECLSSDVLRVATHQQHNPIGLSNPHSSLHFGQI